MSEEPQYVYTIGVSDPKIRDFVTSYIVKEIDPEVVMDLGCGSGAYGKVLKRKIPNVHMIGLDGCFKYLTSMYCLGAYEARIHMDIMDYLMGPVYVCQDLTICMDVIEHFEKTEAITVMNHLPEPAIISTPLFDYEQGMIEGNPLEEHKCFFTEEEILELGFDKLYSVEYDERGDIGAFIKR